MSVYNTLCQHFFNFSLLEISQVTSLLVLDQFFVKYEGGNQIYPSLPQDKTTFRIIPILLGLKPFNIQETRVPYLVSNNLHINVSPKFADSSIFSSYNSNLLQTGYMLSKRRKTSLRLRSSQFCFYFSSDIRL